MKAAKQDRKEGREEGKTDTVWRWLVHRLTLFSAVDSLAAVWVQ